MTNGYLGQTRLNVDMTKVYQLVDVCSWLSKAQHDPIGWNMVHIMHVGCLLICLMEVMTPC